MSEYPKVIVTGGVKVIVTDAKDEARWRESDVIPQTAVVSEPEPDEPEPKKKTKSHKKT